MKYLLALILLLNTLPGFAARTLDEQILKVEGKIQKTTNEKKLYKLDQELAYLKHYREVELLLRKPDLNQTDCLKIAELGTKENNYFRQNDIIIKMIKQCHISESTLNTLQQFNQQAQLNNIQNQQNYTNWLLLQQQLNSRY